MSTLSGTKRGAKSPQRPGETEEQRKKRKGREATANSRKLSNQCWKKLIQGAGVLTISVRSPEYPGLV
jgi:hypothetical protein